MIKRKSTAGKLAQAMHDHWAREYGMAGGAFPKTQGAPDNPSVWTSSAHAALEYLADTYGFDPDADIDAVTRSVQERLPQHLAEKNKATPPPDGYAWSLAYDDTGSRRPGRDVLLAIADGHAAATLAVEQHTCTKCLRPVRGPGLTCGVHTSQRVGDTFGLSVAAEVGQHTCSATTDGMRCPNFVRAEGRLCRVHIGETLDAALGARSPDTFAEHLERALSFASDLPGVLKFGPGAPLAEYEDRPETWPIGTPVRVGVLEGKIVKSPARVRVEFPADRHGQRHSGEFLAKFVHRVAEEQPTAPPEGARPQDVDNGMCIVRPGWPTALPPVLAVNRIAVYCNQCMFYRENWVAYGLEVLRLGEQHHHQFGGLHVVHVKRNPEEPREQVKR